MIINGRETGFRLSVYASALIADRFKTKNVDPKKLIKQMKTARYVDQIIIIADLAECLSCGYEAHKRSIDPTHKENPLQRIEILSLGKEDFEAVARALQEELTKEPEVDAEPIPDTSKKNEANHR